MRFSTAARLLALLGIVAQPAPGHAQDLVERVRAATGVKAKPAAQPAKSKPRSKPKPRPKVKAKPKASARKGSSKPAAKKSPAPAAPPAPAEASAEPAATPPAQRSESKPAATPPAAAKALPGSAVAPGKGSTQSAPSAPPAPATGTAATPAPDGTAEVAAAPSEPAATPPLPAASAPPAQGSAAEAASAGLQLAMFVDAYATWQSGGSGTQATLSNHRAFSGQGSTLRAENGFGLAFVGLDASYGMRHAGATASLRFGEGVPLYHLRPSGESDAAFGVEQLTQAYLTWRPWQVLALDLGMFDTPFGAEVLQSWQNLNYTRGALYYYAQPGWHSGLRVQWDPSDSLALVGFVANGSNIISEAQQEPGTSELPTVGAQLGWAPSEALWLAAGGLFATDARDNDDAGFDALGDVIVRFEQYGLQAVLNANYVLTLDGAPDGSDRHLFGVSAAAGYAFSKLFGAALRGEWLLDDANHDGGERERWRLFTVTLTTEVKPLAAAPHLILRWDNRWEESNQRIFGKDARVATDPADDSYADVWFQSVLGVVVTSAP